MSRGYLFWCNVYKTSCCLPVGGNWLSARRVYAGNLAISWVGASEDSFFGLRFGNMNTLSLDCKTLLTESCLYRGNAVSSTGHIHDICGRWVSKLICMLAGK